MLLQRSSGRIGKRLKYKSFMHEQKNTGTVKFSLLSQLMSALHFWEKAMLGFHANGGKQYAKFSFRLSIQSDLAYICHHMVHLTYQVWLSCPGSYKWLVRDFHRISVMLTEIAAMFVLLSVCIFLLLVLLFCLFLVLFLSAFHVFCFVSWCFLFE